MLEVNDRIRVPEEEFSWTFVRSGGPGGQNVNKVASKAVLRWSVGASPNLPDDVRARFRSHQHRRITVEGDLVLTSQRYRDQEEGEADPRFEGTPIGREAAQCRGQVEPAQTGRRLTVRRPDRHFWPRPAPLARGFPARRRRAPKKRLANPPPKSKSAPSRAMTRPQIKTQDARSN
jgi:ribosome-associated protein